MKMKKYGVILFGLSLALVTSCTKDEVEIPVDNSKPVVPSTSQELTGVFEGEWMCMDSVHPTRGSIVVNNGYTFVDELPAEGIFNEISQYVLSICNDHPEKKAAIIDSIGNIFFASSYKYPMTDLQIKYKLVDYSAIDGIYYAKMLSIKNKLSDITTTICIDREPPYPSETIVIDAPEPNTISLSVWADKVLYRIDMVSKEREVNAEFYMGNGMWMLQYWFNTFRVINMQTGKYYDFSIIYDNHRLQQGKEDTIQLRFNATKRTGSAEERIVPYI